MTEDIPEEIQEPQDQTAKAVAIRDMLREEIDEEPNPALIMEATRYTSLNKMIDEGLTEFHTQLSKKAIEIIMIKLNWIKAYKITFADAMTKSETFKLKALELLNAHQEEIVNYMKLQVAKDGWRAKQVFKTLQGDEKEAKKWGFQINQGERDRTAMDD